MAAARSVDALKKAGVDAELWTGEVSGSGHRAKWVARLDSVPQRFFPNRRLFTAWSNGWWPDNIVEKINQAAPDVVHLHWIGHGFMALSQLAGIKAPVVWSMHDLWAFTGGCHYPGDCSRFTRGCGSCPQLASPAPFDLSGWNHRRKKAMAAGVRRWVAPSDWIRAEARRSGFIKDEEVRTIPNTLNMDVFTAERRAEARHRMGVAGQECVLAVGSMELDEIRKGNHLLPRALAAWRAGDPSTRVRLVVFGGSRLPRIDVAGLEIVRTGLLSSEREMADIMAAADAFILPSLQDNLPNVAVEAQACGCPVLGFDSGGLREIIESGATGWLAAEKTAESLGATMADFTREHVARREEVALACRRRALDLFSPGTHVRALCELYEEVVR